MYALQVQRNNDKRSVQPTTQTAAVRIRCSKRRTLHDRLLAPECCPETVRSTGCASEFRTLLPPGSYIFMILHPCYCISSSKAWCVASLNMTVQFFLICVLIRSVHPLVTTVCLTHELRIRKVLIVAHPHASHGVCKVLQQSHGSASQPSSGRSRPRWQGRPTPACTRRRMRVLEDGQNRRALVKTSTSATAWQRNLVVLALKTCVSPPSKPAPD